FAAGGATPGLVSSAVSALVKEGTQSMLTKRLELAVCFLVTVVLALGAGTLARRVLAQPDAGPAARRAAPPAPGKGPKKDAGDALAVRGVVLGPGNKPFRGAEIYVIHNEAQKLKPTVRARSG